MSASQSSKQSVKNQAKSGSAHKRASDIPPMIYTEDTVLLTLDQCRTADQLAEKMGVSPIHLMEKAGKQVAAIVSQSVESPDDLKGPIAVLCGPGNNGGDGFVAARYLKEKGFTVAVYLHGDKNDLKGNARYMADRWDGDIHPLNIQSVEGAPIIIDAILAAGLNRSLDDGLAPVIDAANGQDALRVAVDLPTGLNGDTGQVMGSCFRADLTVTFLAKKPAHVLLPGRFLCGGLDHIHVVDIGIPVGVLKTINPLTAINNSFGWQYSYPVVPPMAHKYHKGHVLVLGGKEPTLGASRLSAMAALRSGAGLVSLACPNDSYTVQATALTDVMVRRFDSNMGFVAFLQDPRLNVVTIGPGAGVSEKTAKLVRSVCEKNVSLVLDADGISSFAGRANQLADYMNPADPKMVITPHEGEFMRLFPDISLTEGRLQAACQAAETIGAVVVLKGNDTIIASPDGRSFINATAPVWLSVAGTGDVLSGIIAGLLAQGMPMFEASAAAVFFHSEAAMQAGKGMIASDLLPIIPRVLP